MPHELCEAAGVSTIVGKVAGHAGVASTPQFVEPEQVVGVCILRRLGQYGLALIVKTFLIC